MTRAQRFVEEVKESFGIMPRFFETGMAAEGLSETLFNFSKGCYIDSPLPSLFKERLFVYLSKFCEVRYCIVRHCGFLLGKGFPAGDKDATSSTIDEVVELIKRPYPNHSELSESLGRLRNLKQPINKIPDPNTPLETDIFVCICEIFLHPQSTASVRSTLKGAIGQQNYEYLVGLVTFIQTAHYWTLIHPELEYEPDVEQLLKQQEVLKGLLLDNSEAQVCEVGSRVQRELLSLRKEKVEYEKLKKTKKELADTKEFLENIISTMPIGVLVSGHPEGSVLYFNSTFEQITGITVSKGQPIKDCINENAIHPDGSRYSINEYPTVRAVSNGEIVQNEELIFFDANGIKRIVMVNATPIKDQAGKVLGAITAILDITDLKNSQSNLLQALNARDEFLSVASHELKTPLTSLLMQVELLRLKLSQGLDLETVRMCTDKCDSLIRSMAQQIDQMLDISRMSSRGLHLETRPFSLVDVVEQVVKQTSFSELISIKIIKTPIGKWDQPKIVQAIGNILANAIKYGKGRQVDVVINCIDKQAILSVRDYGVGISDDKLPGIFKIYERAINKNEVSGLGLGLYLTDQIVRGHGGKVEVESKLGEGSQFIVFLPALDCRG